jgi:hypothetical protein
LNNAHRKSWENCDPKVAGRPHDRKPSRPAAENRPPTAWHKNKPSICSERQYRQRQTTRVPFILGRNSWPFEIRDGGSAPDYRRDFFTFGH